ncbi:hypothetical protein [Rhizobium rhizogenes]|uniref:hypothetical protein n=1 Tax=Rhizobium rhizogenes TaxID=359 RepID=UPI001F322FCF|nr:hypothetical protein [Rhizobium rhizogenes]
MQLPVIEADFPSDMGTDIAAPYAMARRLPLRHVEGLAQSLHDFSQADLNTHNADSPDEVLRLADKHCRNIETGV